MRFAIVIKFSKFLLSIRIWVFLIVPAIIIWQTQYIHYKKLDSKYSRTDASGLSINQAREFTYSYYYLNLYPYRVAAGPIEYNTQKAKELFENNPGSIYNNYQNFITWGEHGRSVYLLAAAYLKGTTENLDVHDLNGLLFIVALVCTYLAFEYNGLMVLGLLLVILFGSNPFQLYSVYINNNIFGLAITTMLILLSINLPVIVDTLGKYYIYFASILSAIILACLSHIRTEFIILFFSCFIIYSTAPSITLKKRIITTFIFTFYVFFISLAIGQYFKIKVIESEKFLAKIAPANRLETDYSQIYHTFWHPVWIGFSDFDTKYNTAWSDNAAYSYAYPILIERYPEKFEKYRNQNQDLLSVHPEYAQLMKETALKLIFSDPIWYLTILWKRLNVVLLGGPPILVNFKDFVFEIPFHPILSIYVAGYLVYKKRYDLLKIALFSLPLSIPVLIIFSGKGINNVTSFHYSSCAVFLYLCSILFKRLLKLVINKR